MTMTVSHMQALAILDALELHVAVGDAVVLVHAGPGEWLVRAATGEHRGESVADALGQYTTVLTLGDSSHE